MTQQQWGQSGQGWNSQPAQNSSWGQPSQAGYSGGGHSGGGYSGGGQWGGQQNQWRQPAPSQGQWGAPGGGSAPTPRKSSGMSPLLIGAVVVLAVVMLAYSAFGGSSGGGGGGNVAYQNEDYQVPAVNENPPPLDEPGSYDELEKWGTDNPFYKQSVPSPTRCEMDHLDLTQASQSQVQTHLNELTACLMRVWGDPIEEAGWKPVRFKTNIYGAQKVSTPCGQIPPKNAVFCYANQQMYYSMTLPQVLPPELRNKPFVVETVLAHEFGHGIQGRTGLAVSALVQAQEASAKTEKNQWKRKLELQADCFSGQFINSVSVSRGMTNADVDNLKLVVRALGDDTLTGKPNFDGDHGLARSREYWMQMGLASTGVGACNTFVAPAEQIR